MNLTFFNNTRLPSPPAIALKILEAVKNEDCSFNDFAQIIKSDPVLTAKILKVANSAYYSPSIKISSIERAISMLGMVLLKNLALSFAITKEFKKDSVGGDFNYDLFWRRAVTSAVSSEMVSKLTGQKFDDAFVTAILQDIGIIVMYYNNPSAYLHDIGNKLSSGNLTNENGQGSFGFDHQEISSELLRIWGIPESIHQPIRYHHRPVDAPEEFRTHAHILQISCLIADGYHSSGSIKLLQESLDCLENEFGTDRATAENMVDDVVSRCEEIFSFFELGLGQMKPFSQILQEANEELSRLNMSYEQLVLEYKQARDGAEQLAFELRVANDRLKELALRDGLTGLFNHRYFQELMDAELSKAIRGGQHLTLILLDIDDFKKVNDTYGHIHGDHILKTISSEILKVIRPTDVAARYGGEEFAIILPNTRLQGESAFIAERLRTTIERLHVIVDDKDIVTTVSIGVASISPDNGNINKDQLIAEADKALYKSKELGKNRYTLACNV